MKKFIVFLVIIAIVFACNDASKDKQPDSAAGGKTVTDPSSNPDYQKGLELIAKSDCLTCHKIDERIPNQGPSYREVANKYGSMPDTIVNYLSRQIINGSTGVWGEAVMISHPSITEEEAKAMAKYILLLKQ